MTNHSPANEAGTNNDTLDTVFETLRRRLPVEDQAALGKAYDIAHRAHAGQWRKSRSGTPDAPYLAHPLRVGRILADEWGACDLRILAVALLHDVLEDCPPDQKPAYAREIRRELGSDILHGVEVLTKHPALFEGKSVGAANSEAAKVTRQTRYFAALADAPAFVRLIKLADRLDNLRDALAWGDAAFWERYRSETIAWHLGLAYKTSPVAEMALCVALLEGERQILGRGLTWAEGYLIDPAAVGLIPEHDALAHNVIAIARRGDTLVVGLPDPDDAGASGVACRAAAMHGLDEIETLLISEEGIHDALESGIYEEHSA